MRHLGLFFAEEDTRTLRAINDLVGAGKVSPVLDRTYPLDETRAAVRHRAPPGGRLRLGRGT